MSEIDPKLGELIKKKRIERRLTQEEVAELVGCHPQYYKNLENGKGITTLRKFRLVSQNNTIKNDIGNRGNPIKFNLFVCKFLEILPIICYCI